MISITDERHTDTLTAVTLVLRWLTLTTSYKHNISHWYYHGHNHWGSGGPDLPKIWTTPNLI